MKVLKWIHISIFFLLLCIPALHHSILPIPFKELGGTFREQALKAPSFESILSGDFQQGLERWLTRNTGMWPYLIRSENQFNFSVFGMASDRYASTVVRGKNKHLIERAYLNPAAKIQSVPLERIEQKVTRLKKLQAYLEQRGKTLLVLISANKPSLYPEVVPTRFTLPGKDKRQSSYDIMLPLLREAGINTFDAAAFLEERKAQLPYPLFATTGTHWNEYAACLVTKELRAQLATLLKKNIADISCDPIVVRDVPSYADRDLSRTLNIWFPESLYTPQARPKSSRITPPNEEAPDLLFVGTSFMWALFEYFDRHQIYKERNFFYYFKSNYAFPARTKRPIQRENLDWEREVFSNDAIVFEVNQAFVHKVSYGFLKHIFQSSQLKSQRSLSSQQ